MNEKFFLQLIKALQLSEGSRTHMLIDLQPLIREMLRQSEVAIQAAVRYKTVF